MFLQILFWQIYFSFLKCNSQRHIVLLSIHAYYRHVWEWSRVVSRFELKQGVFRSVLWHRRIFIFHWSAFEGVQRGGQKCGYTSIKTLVCPLWCYAAMHFSYKVTAFLSERTEVKDIELFLSSLHYNITVTHIQCTAEWCVFRGSSVGG